MSVIAAKFSPAALPMMWLLFQVPMVPPLKFSALPLPVMWTALRRMALLAFGWMPTELKLTSQPSRSTIPPAETAVVMTTPALVPVELLIEITELLTVPLARFEILTPLEQRVMFELLTEKASLRAFVPSKLMPARVVSVPPQSVMVVSCTIRRAGCGVATRMPFCEKFMIRQSSMCTVAPDVKLMPFVPRVVPLPLIERLRKRTVIVLGVAVALSLTLTPVVPEARVEPKPAPCVPSMVMDLVMVTAPKPPGSRQSISPPAAVFEMAPAKVLHGAVRLHGLTSWPTPATQVRVAWAWADDAAARISIIRPIALKVNRILLMIKSP